MASFGGGKALPYKGAFPKPPPQALPPSATAPGLRVRFKRIKGETARGVLEVPLYLPVVIGEFVDEENFAFRDYDTVGAGEFSSPQSADPRAVRLRDLDLDTLTIDWHRYAYWLSNPSTSPDEVRTILRKLGRSKTPFEVFASLRGSGEELRRNVTMRTLGRTLKPGEADTRYFTIVTKEWRPNGVKRTGSGSGGKGSKAKLPTTERITEKTTLRSAAKEFYGSKVDAAYGYKLIGRANGLARWGGSDPIHKAKGWKVGDKLKIPKIPDAVDGPRNPI